MSGSGAVVNAAIRDATAADRPDIERLLRASALPLDGVAEALPGFMVAEMNNELIGVAGIEYAGECGLLRSAAVAETSKGHGVGEKLVTGLIGQAKQRKLRALFLLTTTAETYFPRFGFEQVTRDEVPLVIRETVEFTSACPASATVMRLEIPE
jgi:amino-acid N-acetyltransferase